MAMQGFDDNGAAAAQWGGSDRGFTVSGVFRDLADFAVLVLFEKDDPFGHPLFSYLPDGDLTGLVLDLMLRSRVPVPGIAQRVRGPTGARSIIPSTASATTT